MPKIDTSAISGFSEMTTEQQIQALLNLDIPETPDMSQFVRKSVFDNTAHELSEAKKKLTSKLTEEELAQAERERVEAENANKFAELETKYNALLKKSTIAEYKAKYIASGYKPELAEKAANALADGKTDDLLAVQAEFQKELEAKIKSELLADPKGPNGYGAKPGEADPENVAIAKQIGQRRAEESKKTADALSKYIGR